MKALALIFAIFLNLHAAGDVNATRAAAEKLLNLFNMDSVYDQTMQQAVAMSLQMIDAQALPEEKKEQAKNAMAIGMNVTLEKFSWARMKGMFIEIYAEALSREELEGLIAFYQSPIGQSFLRKQPQLTRVTMQKMQALMMEVMPEVQAEVEKALEAR